MTNGTDQGPDISAEEVNDLFDSIELTKAIQTEEFRTFLDHLPLAIAISKEIRTEQRICYANKAYEVLLDREVSEFAGRGWSVLTSFKNEADSNLSLHDAIVSYAEDFLGTFRFEGPEPLIVEAYSGQIENDDGTENYRILALIDVTNRVQAEREEYIRNLRDKDLLLKEMQHRVKNNLQLVIALIRLEARNKNRGATINLVDLAGRIESLQLLYQALSPDGNGGEVDLGHYLSQIAAAAMNSYAVDGVRLDLKVDHAPVSINIALPIGLVVNELLTNSFKYAFGGRGHGLITIECLREGNEQYCVVVADDGVGLPNGTVWPVPGKISALIVQTLRENSKAEFKVETASGKGVRATINFRHKAPTPQKN